MRRSLAPAGVAAGLWLACATLLPACFSVHVQSDTSNLPSNDAGHTRTGPIDSGIAPGQTAGGTALGKHDSGSLMCVSGSCQGSAGTGMANPPPTCTARAQLAGDEVDKALAATDTSCMVDSDCTEFQAKTSCFASCFANVAISAATAPALSKELARIEHDVCGSFIADGCTAELPPCPPPSTNPTMPGCKSGHCTSVPASAQGPTMCPGCLSETISWGANGGDVAYSDLSKLAPCAHYSRVRTPSSGSVASPLSCATDLVACNSSASVGAVETALANEDVKLARIGASPVLYGRDARPVDGTVFEITLGGLVIDVGDACNGQMGCSDVPAGIRSLVDELVAVDKQLLTLPACKAFAP